jgi:hypothetical protein
MDKEMYSYSYDRIDFVPKVRCFFCNNLLTKGYSLYLVHNATGNEVPSGPVCAVKNAGDLNHKIPDFTRASFLADKLEVTSKVTTPPKKPNPSSGIEKEQKKETLLGQKELEYLRLRIEKLKLFPDAYYAPLIPIWERFKCSSKSKEDILYIKRLISKSYSDMPLLSPENLQTCYAYSYWLTVFNNTSAANNFTKAMLSSLQDKNYLTINQITKINSIFEKHPGFPNLDSSAFKEAVKNDAEIRPWAYKRKNN